MNPPISASAPTWLALRVLGGLALLAVGAVHLQQYLRLYSTIPTIGVLFLVNFAAATVIGFMVMVPFEHLLRRGGRALAALSSAAGIGLAAGTMAFLLLSERMPVFGFEEPGYDPVAIDASRGAEIAVIVFLGSWLIGSYVTTRRRDKELTYEKADAVATSGSRGAGPGGV